MRSRKKDQLKTKTKDQPNRIPKCPSSPKNLAMPSPNKAAAAKKEAPPKRKKRSPAIIAPIRPTKFSGIGDAEEYFA